MRHCRSRSRSVSISTRAIGATVAEARSATHGRGVYRRGRATPTDISIGTELAGYRIESVLGRGGMGVVYLAFDPQLKRRVALKVLAPELAHDPSFRERFVRESEVAASLDHPNVVPIFQAGEQDGVLYIAMRYVE